MSQPISLSAKAPKLDSTVITHQTTPLPLTRASQKEKPVSPGRILRKYQQFIHENNDDDPFPMTEDVSHIHSNHSAQTTKKRVSRHLENDAKRAEARKSYNNVLVDLSTAAASAKIEHQKRKSREIMPEIQSNNNEYSSDSSYTSYTHSHSRSHSLSNHDPTNRPHNIAAVPPIQKPYIDDDGSETDSNVDSSFSNDPNASVARSNRYSTFVKQYVHQPMDDDDDDEDEDEYEDEEMDQVMEMPDTNPTAKKGVSFADSIRDKPAKRSRVRFSIHTDDVKHDSDSSSSLTSQRSEDLMDFWNDNKPTYDDIESEIEKMNSFHGDDLKKHRQSKFFKFAGTNFMQSTLTLRNLTANLTSIDINKEPLNTPGAPLPDAMENTIEFSDTASTTDFNEHLWRPVSDRSDSSDDSFLPKRKKSRKRKTKKRNTALKQRSAPVSNGGGEARASYDEKDIAAQIDLFKRSVLNDEDMEDDDEDAYTLDDESSSANPFDMAIREHSDDTDDSDSIHSAYYKDSKHQKGDRMWFRHHIGHLKVLKKFFREMDKDKDGTISFDEFTKFLSKYGVNKKFTAEEIERFFLKVTEASFDPDHPNAIEDKMNSDHVISPDLLAHSHSSLHAPYKDMKNLTGTRKSGVAKKTSIFFKKAKAVPTGEVDMATFLFYFSSPIDSHAMNHQYQSAPDLAHMQSGGSTKGNSVISTADNIARNKLAATYSKAVARAADKARNRSSNNKKKSSRIDPSLLFITRGGGKKGSKKPIHKRHSLMTQSTSKKLKKRKNKNDLNPFTKRGSISTLRSYHFKQRESKNKLLESDDFDILENELGGKSRTVPRVEDIERMHGLAGITASELRESGATNSKATKRHTHKAGQHSADEWMDKKYQSAEELSGLIKMMKRNISLQDRDRKNNKYKNCFVGRDVVTWFLSKGFVSSRHGGLLLGRRLAQKKYIQYAGNEERDFEDEIIFFYQFTNKHEINNKSTDEMDSLRSSLLEPTLTGMESYSDGNVTEMKEDSIATTTSSAQMDASLLQNASSFANDDGANPNPNHSASDLALIVSKMGAANIARTSHRSNTLSDKADIYSGKEIVDWLIKYNESTKDRSEAIQFGTSLRSKGFIRHIEFHPVFKDAEDEWYRICDHDVCLLNDDDDDGEDDGTENDLNNNNKSALFANHNNHNKPAMNHIMENEVNTVSSDQLRATIPVAAAMERRQNDSVASTMTTNSDYKPLFFGVERASTQHARTSDRTSLVLGQMGRGRATRGRKREKLVEELFTFIIASQITTGDEATSHNMSADALYEMDRIVDGADHPHITKLLSKIEIKFKKCDEHGRGSLGKEEFNRFLIKCGVILHQQDLNVVFKMFDKNNTGLIDYYNFSENALVHRVPGIETDHLSVTHLIKHTISVNFGISAGRKGNDDQFTVMSMAISAAFEEINTSSTGEITLDEFRLAYRKHGIEIYGGVTQIFQRLSKNGATVTLANFIEAFQGTIFANRSEAPKLKEVLSKLGIIQWTLGDPSDAHGLYAGGSHGGGASREHESTLLNEYDDDNSANTITTNAGGTHPGPPHTVQKLLSPTQLPPNAITPQTMSAAISDGSSADTNNNMAIIDNTGGGHMAIKGSDDDGGFIVGPPPPSDGGTGVDGIQSPTVLSSIGTTDSKATLPGVNLLNESTTSLHTNKRQQSIIQPGGGGGDHGRGRTETLNTARTSFSDVCIPLDQSEGGGIAPAAIDIVTADATSLQLDRPRSISSGAGGDGKASKSPHSMMQIRLNWREVSNKVFVTFLKSSAVIALPGVILNSLLHFVQAIPVNTATSSGKDFPLIDLTWYLFGFLVYLALQSTMVGFEVTKSLIFLYTIVAGTVGAGLAIATIVGFALEEELYGSNSVQNLRNWGLGWWIGLFLVYLICECAARLKFMKVFGTQRTRREYCWYAVSHAIGVTMFWFLQTFMSIIVVNVSFDDAPRNRWPLIIYCALTLTVIRNLSLNTLGTAFIGKLSDHFYLEDVEVMEMRTDQMLLTQLSIIASYSPLWYLFTKTTETDWNWVICGIAVYQSILLLMDITLTTYIRPKMISLLKGELIAWLAVGARAIMSFFFPLGFNENNLIQQEYDDKWTKYIDASMTRHERIRMNCIWCATYALGPTLLLLLLWLRIYKIWSYENIEDYWDFNEFTIQCNKCNRCCSCKRKENDESSQGLNNGIGRHENEATSQSQSQRTLKQRNRLMIICALTIGFIVSVTEAVSLWSDDASSQKYEGFVDLDF